MDEVKQAFSISDKKKAHALRLYKEAVSEMVRKDYKAIDNDAHVALSSLFGIRYIKEIMLEGICVTDAKIYAASNIEFNYANCLYSKKHKFITLAKELVPENERIDDAKLEYIAGQMDYILTFTTPKAVNREFILFR